MPGTTVNKVFGPNRVPKRTSVPGTSTIENHSLLCTTIPADELSQSRERSTTTCLQEPEAVHAANRDVLLLCCISYVYKLLPYCLITCYTIGLVFPVHTFRCIFVMYDVKTSR